jgi:transcriptional regulator with XRE-family HTH domain
VTAPHRELGACLRLLRLARAWGLARAARAAGLQLSRLSQIELGHGNPSHAMIERIVGALGYPMLGLEIARLLVRAAGDGDGGNRGGGDAGGRERRADGGGDDAADIARADPARHAPPAGRACAGLVGVFALGEPASAAMTGEETGRALRLLRQVRGWTQRQAAEAAGLARSALSAIERGRPPGDPAALAALAGRMGLSAPSFDLAGLLVRMGRQARPATPDTPESAGDSPARTSRARRPSAALCARAEGLERPGLRLGLVIFDEGEGAGGQGERPHPAAVPRLPGS